jgi:hypothetical protein
VLAVKLEARCDCELHGKSRLIRRILVNNLFIKLEILMNVKKIEKYKSFNKRMSVIIEGVKECDPTIQSALIKLLSDSAKYPAEHIETAALALYLNVPNNMEFIENAIEKNDHPGLLSELFALLHIAGEHDKAWELINDPKWKIPLGGIASSTWAEIMFGNSNDDRINQLKDRIKSFGDGGLKYLENLNNNPPIPSSHSSSLRYFYDNHPFEWNGTTKS